MNQSYMELFDKLVSSGSDDYYEITNQTSIVSGTANYALPTDFYKMLGVDIVRTDGSYVSLSRFSRGDRNKFSVNSIATVDRERTMYRIRGAFISLIPTPAWSETNGLRMNYVKTPTEFVEGASSAAAQAANIDGISGWEDWIVFDCLTKFIGGKEEGDSTKWEQLQAKLNARIEEMKMRDRGEPDYVRDVDEEAADRIWPRYGLSV